MTFGNTVRHLVRLNYPRLKRIPYFTNRKGCQHDLESCLVAWANLDDFMFHQLEPCILAAINHHFSDIEPQEVLNQILVFDSLEILKPKVIPSLRLFLSSSQDKTFTH